MEKVISEGIQHEIVKTYYLEGIQKNSDIPVCILIIKETAEGQAYIENKVWNRDEVVDITPEGSQEVKIMFPSLRVAIARGSKRILTAYPDSTILSDVRGGKKAVMVESTGSSRTENNLSLCEVNEGINYTNYGEFAQSQI
ncbi:MAG: hypothetical protein WC539_02725 [Nitrospirota bacterium]